MNTHTKHIFILSLILLAGAFAVCGLLIHEINTKGEKLEAYAAALTEKNAEETAFIRVNRLVQDTEEERAALNRAFFSDEGDSVSFLGDIESFADSVGLDLTTEGLDKITKDGSEYITMTFVYSGDERQVFSFTKYLENLPYHSSITAHSFTRGTGGLWDGSVTILISLKTPA